MIFGVYYKKKKNPYCYRLYFPHMPVFYIKLKNKSDNILLQSILGTYSHLMWVRTEIPEEMVVKIITTPDLLKDSKKILDDLKKEIEFEYIDWPSEQQRGEGK